MNSVNLIGRLAATPELRYTGTKGTAVCNFTVVVEDTFKDSDGNAVVDWIDCVIWGQSATFLCKWFDKGVRVGLTGRLKTRKYEKDGQAHKVTEVRVSEVHFADGKREANTIATSTAGTDDDFLPVDDFDGLPFD